MLGRCAVVVWVAVLAACQDSQGPVPGAAYLPDASMEIGRDRGLDAPLDDGGVAGGADGAVATPEAAALFAQLCAPCHGPLGEGGAGPALTGLGGRDRAALVDRIERTMPSQRPELCVGACAEAMADLILDVLSVPPEACDAAGAVPRRLRLLTRREYAHSLRDLFFFDAVACSPPTFRLSLPDRRPATVHVAGSFNGWPGTVAGGGWAMAESGGGWTLRHEVPPGRHSYKFVLDERDWITDPQNPLHEPDGFGGENSVLEVPPCEGPPDVADFTGGIPPETRPEGFAFETHAASGRVTSVHLEAYLDNAERAARAALARGGAWLPCREGEAGCAERFVVEVGRRVFRRALTAEEVTRYTTRAQDRGFEAALTALLASPHFLYRSEQGVPTSDGRFVLTGPERATALAYFLWGSTPDDALLDAAEGGRLADEAGLAAEARRLLADPRAGEALEVFAAQWLGIEGLLDAPKAPDLQRIFGTDVRSALLDETRGFLRDTVLDGGRFATLLTAPPAAPSPGLAGVYGADGHGRAGVLGQAAVLATYAHSDQTSPIRRGLFVRQRLLCQTLPPPPPNAGGVPEVDPAATTRERFRQHTASDFCASCHQYIDEVGFGFEAFDAVGRWRSEENGQAVDSAGNMNDVEGLGTGSSAPYADLATLGAVLAASEAAPACFAAKVRQFALGTQEGAADRCAVARLRADFAASGGDLAGLLVDLVTSPEFVTRVQEANP